MVEFNKKYEQQLIEAFQHFIQDEPFDHSFMRKEIYDSWVRSKAFHVEYDAPIKIKKLEDQEVKELIQKKSALIEAARKHLSKIYDVIKPTGYYIFISDERGYLLDIISDHDLMEQYLSLIHI